MDPSAFISNAMVATSRKPFQRQGIEGIEMVEVIESPLRCVVVNV